MTKASVGKILKFVLLAVLVAAAVFFIINVIQYGKGAGDAAGDIAKAQMNSALFQNLALAIAVLGIAVYLLLDILGMSKIGSFILVGAGIVAVVLLIVALSVAGPYLDQLKAAIDVPLTSVSSPAKAAYYGTIFTGISEAIVFGAAPIIYGLNKLLVKN
ncbi:MAG: hypothetical protein LBN07_04065 [Christensenellaceae bacterium]|jgi:hypothetical protein|nr:hypothetical protein [Christensenellaceae bacterium]